MKNFTVYGYCDKGLKFRPSNWTKRLVNEYTANQKSRECIYIFNIGGIKGIKIKTCLENIGLELLNHILDFASMNNLTIKYE